MAHFETLLFLVLCLIFLRFCRIISTHCNVVIDDNLGRECLIAERVMSLPSSALPKRKNLLLEPFNQYVHYHWSM